MSISGKFVAVKIGATPATLVGVQSWSAEDNSQELDGTTAEDEGFENPDSGLSSLSVSMQLVIDITAGSLTPVQAGTILTDLKLFADASSTDPIYSVPTARVGKSTPKGEINGRFTLDLQVKSKGPYTLNDPN